MPLSTENYPVPNRPVPNHSVPNHSVQLQQFAARTLLPPRTSLWRIESGFIRTLTWLEDGTVVVLGLWGPGDRVGQILSHTDPYCLECLTSVQAVAEPIASETLQAMLRLHNHQLESLLSIRSYKRTETMILKLLAWLADRFGQKLETGALIDLRLTHQDLAEMIGTTRVTVTRLLNQLEEQGLIQRSSLQKIILRPIEAWHYEI